MNALRSKACRMLLLLSWVQDWTSRDQETPIGDFWQVRTLFTVIRRTRMHIGLVIRFVERS